MRRNLLAEPHEEDRPGRQRDRNDQDVDRIGIEDRLLEADGHADGLEESEDDREVTRDLGGFLVPFFAFLTPLFECRDDNVQQLDDDRSIDVRRDAHGKDGKLAECTTGEQIQEAEEVAVLEQRFERRRVNPRNRDVRPHPENGEHHQSKDDLLPEFRNLEDVRKG